MSFAPDRRLGWLAVAAAGAFVLAAAFSDAAGRLLSALAALALLAQAANDLVGAPRLVADGHGLQVRTIGRRVTVPWNEVERLTVDERSRLGRRNRCLEIDCGERLLVLSGHALGADPRDALRALESARSPQGR